MGDGAPDMTAAAARTPGQSGHPDAQGDSGRPPGAGEPGPCPGEAPPVHDARALTAGGARARIALDGQLYQLTITRQGKLILTK
jgi:hemin uptake protein HemP